MKKMIAVAAMTALLLLERLAPAIAQAQSKKQIETAWQALAANDQAQAEAAFLATMASDKNNLRAYLGLSYLYSMQTKNRAAWQNFEKALALTPDPNPYIYAAWATGKMRDANYNMKDEHLALLEKLGQQADAGGALKAMANDQLAQHFLSKGDFTKSQEYFQKAGTLREWTVIGPFDNVSASGYDKVFPPELEYSPAKEYEGKNTLPVSWFALTATPHTGWINHRDYFSHLEAVYYANTFVYAPAKMRAQLRLGTSGSVKAFLNDELMIAGPDENNNDLDTYIVTTELQAGWNRLLIKCGFSEIYSCNFLARITDEAGAPITGLKLSTTPQAYTARPGAPVQALTNFAETFFQEKIQRHPEHLENYLLLADCYLRNDKATEAELALREALRQTPESVIILHRLLEAYQRGEKYDERATTMERIFTLDKNVPTVLKEKIEEYLKNGDFDKAEERLAALEKLLPESVEVYALQIGLAGKKEQVEKIIALTAKAYEKYPTNLEFVTAQAMLSILLKRDYQQALAIFEKYLAQNQDARVWILLAGVHLQASDRAAWRACYDKALALTPTASGYLSQMGNQYVAEQNYMEAEQAFKKALAIAPGVAQYWSALGANYRAQNKSKEAQQAYREALKFQPRDYEARQALRELEGKKSVFAQFQSADISSLIKQAPKQSAYPEDGAIILLHEAQRAVYEAGASEASEELLVKVFNPRGVEAFKEYWLSYNPYAQALYVDKAVVMKANGAEVKADIAENHLVFKNLEPNDCIYVKWRLKNYYAGKLSRHFWDTFYFNGFYPVKRACYTLLTPANFRFQHKSQNFAQTPKQMKSPEGMIYEWTVENEPAVRYEYDMPPLGVVGKVLHLSSIERWESLVAWYQELIGTKTEITFEIKEQVAALIEGKPGLSQEEKIKAVYEFITENIRYSHVAFRQSRFIPQKARDVLMTKIGDCKDMATLCIAMLRERGITAHYVLAATTVEGKHDNALPAVLFNHCLVAVEMEKGMKFLDLTAYNYPYGALPETDIGAFALVIKSDSKAPIHVPAEGLLANNLFRDIRAELQNDNSIVVHSQSLRTGILTAGTRYHYRHKGAQEIEKDLIASFNRDFPDLKLLGYEFENLDNLAPALRTQYRFQCPNYLKDAGEFKILSLPWFDKAGALAALSYERRNYPFQYADVVDTLVEKIELRLPVGYMPVEPATAERFTCAIADYSLQLSFANGTITAERRLINKKSEVSTAEYAEFKEFWNRVMKQDGKQILLQALPKMGAR